MNWLNEFSDWPWIEWKGKQTCTHRYRWRNDVPLIDSDKSPQVNCLEYQLINDKGKVSFRSGWITSLQITRSNIERLVKTGRCRWKIENECFNTLKNQGITWSIILVMVANICLTTCICPFYWHLPCTKY